MARITIAYYLFALVILIITPFPHVNANGTKDYIVTLKSTKGNEADVHYKWLKEEQGKTLNRANSPDAKACSKSKALKTFSIGKWNAYSGVMSEQWVQEVLMKRPEVNTVSINGKMHILTPIKKRRSLFKRQDADTTVAKTVLSNLDMMDTTGDPLLDNSVQFPKEAGDGVKVFVVDTGVRVTHEQFEGRAKMAVTICADCPNTDDNGHGSHVSGTVAGKTFGVAKKASILGIKVLNAKGAGNNDDVIAGLQFVGDQKQQDPKGIFVVNMSLGGGKDPAVEQAVKALTEQNIHVFVAAGNDGEDACNSSPAAEPAAVTVGAVEADALQITDFSNFGKCVDVFAPGRDVLSCGIDNDNDVAVLSGTSMSTPHVAGAAALLLSKNGDMSPAELQTALKDTGLKDQIVFLSGTENGSPNVLANIRDF